MRSKRAELRGGMLVAVIVVGALFGVAALALVVFVLAFAMG